VPASLSLSRQHLAQPSQRAPHSSGDKSWRDRPRQKPGERAGVVASTAAEKPGLSTEVGGFFRLLLTPGSLVTKRRQLTVRSASSFKEIFHKIRKKLELLRWYKNWSIPHKVPRCAGTRRIPAPCPQSYSQILWKKPRAAWCRVPRTTKPPVGAPCHRIGPAPGRCPRGLRCPLG
jgi:hypothetical protein